MLTARRFRAACPGSPAIITMCDRRQQRVAQLHFRYAAMNSGKSTMVLQYRHTYAACGRQAKVISYTNPSFPLSHLSYLSVTKTLQKRENSEYHILYIQSLFI